MEGWDVRASGRCNVCGAVGKGIVGVVATGVDVDAGDGNGAVLPLV